MSCHMKVGENKKAEPDKRAFAFLFILGGLGDFEVLLLYCELMYHVNLPPKKF